MTSADPTPGSKACASCGVESPEIARFCIACGTPFADGTPVTPVPAAAPAPAQEEERRPITAVFVDIVGSTSRAERLDPEDVLALLEPYYDRLRRVLERHGGTVEKFIGDAVVALFGAPVAHEDDPLRAVRAGLAVIDAIQTLNEEDPSRELSVRVGVTTGEAIVALDAPCARGTRHGVGRRAQHGRPSPVERTGGRRPGRRAHASGLRWNCLVRRGGACSGEGKGGAGARLDRAAGRRAAPHCSDLAAGRTGARSSGC